jgi:hypothetical protein
MENKINQAVRGTQEPSVFRGRRGCKSSNFSRLPVEGEIFSLTFPFIEHAIVLVTFDYELSRDVSPTADGRLKPRCSLIKAPLQLHYYPYHCNHDAKIDRHADQQWQYGGPSNLAQPVQER